MYRQKLAVLTAVMCVAAASNGSLAVEIVNRTTTEVLFDSHGFENDTVGMDASTASPGFWSNGGLPNDVVVTGGVPGAFEGSNYLSTTRGASAGNPRAFLDAPADFAGDEIHAEWMMYITHPPLSDIGLFFTNPANSNIGQIRLGGNGLGTLQDSWSGVITANAYQANLWQKWELDITIGAPNWTITVDGGTPISLIVPGGAAASTGFGHLSFFHNGNQTYFLDAVPEPVSLLLLMGGIGMALGRRARAV